MSKKRGPVWKRRQRKHAKHALRREHFWDRKEAQVTIDLLTSPLLTKSEYDKMVGSMMQDAILERAFNDSLFPALVYQDVRFPNEKTPEEVPRVSMEEHPQDREEEVCAPGGSAAPDSKLGPVTT